jgi:hypothetical protein
MTGSEHRGRTSSLQPEGTRRHRLCRRDGLAFIIGGEVVLCFPARRVIVTARRATHGYSTTALSLRCSTWVIPGVAGDDERLAVTGGSSDVRAG